MTPDELASVTLEHLRAIRADMSDLKARMTGVEIQISAMGQQLAGLTTAVYSGKSDLDKIMHYQTGYQAKYRVDFYG